MVKILETGDGVRLVRCSVTRDGHTVTGSADVTIASSSDDLHITIDLAIAIDGSEPRTRSWDERIPRNLL